MLFAKSGPIVVKKCIKYISYLCFVINLASFYNEMIGVAGMFKMFANYCSQNLPCFCYVITVFN